MIEGLESRRLFSASVATITADETKLHTDLTAEHTAVKTLETAAAGDIPGGTAGKRKLVEGFKTIEANIKGKSSLLGADLAVLKADKSDPSEKAAALANLHAGTAGAKTKLKSDSTVIKNVLAAHPTLINSNPTLASELATVEADNALVKADFAQLQADS
jgi:hypothetical protein